MAFAANPALALGKGFTQAYSLATRQTRTTDIDKADRRSLGQRLHIGGVVQKVGDLKKNIERVNQAGQIVSKVLANPAAVGAIGTGIIGAGGAIAMIQGIASGAPLTGLAGGAVMGGAIGSIIPGVGTLIGAGIGGATGLVGGLITQSTINNVNPFNGLSATKSISPTLNTIGQAGNQGLAAAAKSGAHLADAATSAKSLLGNAANGAAQGLGNLAQGGISKFATGLSQIGSSAFSVPWVPFAATGATVVTAAAMAVIVSTSAFLTSGDIEVGSQYITLTKTADPNIIPNEDVAGAKTVTVQYNILATAKKDENGVDYKITIKEATDTISLRSKSTPAPTVPAAPNISDLAIGQAKTYSQVYNSTYTDTRITNIVKITFDVAKVTEQGEEVVATGETFSASASVKIGNPPEDIGCFVFAPPTSVTVGKLPTTSLEWSEQDKDLIIGAYTVNGRSLGEISPSYESYLCKNGNVNLYRLPGSVLGGYAISENGIVIFDLGLGRILNTRYTLVHESGHIIAWRNGALFTDFTANVFGREPSIRSYKYVGAGTVGEDFPETFAVFFTFKNRKYLKDTTCFDMQTEYPKHFDWIARTLNMEDGPLDSSVPACK